MATLPIVESPEEIGFKIHVQPRSSQNRIEGVYGDALKVRLTAPPVDGQANKLCIQFLAREFKVKKSDVKIVSGHKGRLKKIAISLENLTKEEKNRVIKKLYHHAKKT